MTTQHSRSPAPTPEGDEERTVATGRLTADGAFPPRFSLYALVQVLASTLIALITREIRRAHLYRTDVSTPGVRPEPVAQHLPGRGVRGVHPVSFLTTSTVAYLSWLAAPLALALARHLQNRAPSRH
ncbi:hypothetical protein [Streptomyces sp. NHF165]|uniref:hypothetical protein n=1 Tax=Streptomyces sp. NHF165 TaxID=2175864 RepID=UPI001916FE00|nr:hypothetical protein [Streptomyces sp. NHF165]